MLGVDEGISDEASDAAMMWEKGGARFTVLVHVFAFSSAQVQSLLKSASFHAFDRDAYTFAGCLACSVPVFAALQAARHLPESHASQARRDLTLKMARVAVRG